jgi:putative hemolysin
MALEIVILVLVWGGFVMSEFFFAATELALISTPESYLARLRQEGAPGATAALRLKSNPEWFLSTTLLGNQGSVVVNTVLSTALLIDLMGPAGGLVAVAALPPTLLFFGETLPKYLSRAVAPRLAVAAAPVLWSVSMALFPLVWLLSRATRLVMGLLGQEPGGRADVLSREDLRLALRLDPTELEIGPEERLFIDRLFRFHRRRVSDALVPLVEVVALPITATVAQAIAEFSRTGFARLPVYRDRIDDLIGHVEQLDVLDVTDQSAPVTDFMRPALYLPETASLDRVLEVMQTEGERLAVVVDEYGGAVGLMTSHDVFEEIAGRIDDEFDRDENPIRPQAGGGWLIKPRIEIEELNQTLKTRLPRDEAFETLGGFILDRLGKIPAVGDTVRWRDWTFTVTQATPRTVDLVLATRGPARPAPPKDLP